MREKLTIDRHDGTVHLPNGCSIPPSLSQDAFRQSELLAQSRAEDCGTLPWIYYRFSGGTVDGHEMLTSLCFYDQVLVHVEFTVNLYIEDAKDWSHYSLGVEAAMKDLHDRLLKEMLGTPTGTWPPGQKLSPETTPLSRPWTWQFPWGRVLSTHDSKGGGTFFRVEYGDRAEQAMRRFRTL